MGGTGGAARLAYLPVAQANALRARLLALSQGAHEETPEPTDRELVARAAGPRRGRRSCSAARRSCSSSTSRRVGAASSRRQARPRSRSTLPILLGDAIAIWRRFNRSFNATVAEAPEGLRVRVGPRRDDRRDDPAGQGAGRAARRAAPLAPVRLVPARGGRGGPRPRSLRRRARQAAAAHPPAGRHARRGGPAAGAARARLPAACAQAAAPRALEVAASLSAAVVRVRRALRRHDRRAACANRVVGPADEGAEPAPDRGACAAAACGSRRSTSTRQARTSEQRSAISTIATRRRSSTGSPSLRARPGARLPP